MSKSLIDLLLDTGKYKLKDFYEDDSICDDDFEDLFNRANINNKKKFLNWALDKNHNYSDIVDWNDKCDYISNKLKFNEIDYKRLDGYLEIQISKILKDKYGRKAILDYLIYDDFNSYYMQPEDEVEMIYDACCSNYEDLLLDIINEYIKKYYPSIYDDDIKNVNYEDMSKEELIKEIKRLKGE